MPPHCPKPNCSSFRGEGFAWTRNGGYQRSQDGRWVPRFLCKTCGGGFSLQSFAFSYYLKRANLTVPIAAQLVAGSAHRQIARTVGCAPSTVTRRSARLGRHALMLQALSLQHVQIDEPVVYDDFEGFAHSQFQPTGIGIPVGQRSWFAYGAEAAPHGRGGRMSPAQRRHAAKLALPKHRNSAQGALTRTLSRLLPLARGALHLVTDGHKAYARAVASVSPPGRVTMEVHPNPTRGPKGAHRSAHALRRDHAMFAVDLAHLLIRHSQAHHRRETIAFARRHNALMERLHLFLAWKNLVKRRSERDGKSVTPAQYVGLADAPWSWKRVVARRLFPNLLPLTAEDWRLYRREWVTPHSGPSTLHQLRNAF
jgi:transposase-like protein